MDEYALDIWMLDEKSGISTATVKGRTRKELSKDLSEKFNSSRFWRKLLEAKDSGMYLRKPGMQPFHAVHSKRNMYFMQCCLYYGLSDREIEVAAALVELYHDKAIESKLNISYSTVNTHLKNIYKKLNVGSRAEAIARLTTNPEPEEPSPENTSDTNETLDLKP